MKLVLLYGQCNPLLTTTYLLLYQVLYWDHIEGVCVYSIVCTCVVLLL